MVFQCNDCKIWFRSQSKFNNHKKGALGLSCSVSDSGIDNDTDSKVKSNEISHSKMVLSAMEISDDEESLDKNQSTQINNSMDDVISDEDTSDVPKDQDINIKESAVITRERIPATETEIGPDSSLSPEPTREVRGEAGVGTPSPRLPLNPLGVSPKLSGPEEPMENSKSSSHDKSITVSDDEDFSDQDPGLPVVPDVTLVCVHLDTLKVSSEAGVRISQVGCTTTHNQTFFTPIKPGGLEFYLENYKMEGDLLKALHITESQNGKFEFRAQFEIKRKEKNKIYCSTEEEATENIRNYLKQFQKIVLFGIDRETVATLLKKVNQDGSLPVIGILTWSDVLTFSTKYLGTQQYESDLDLEDFYTKYCGSVSGYINTLDVSTFLSKSFKKLFSEYVKKLSQKVGDIQFSWYEIFKEIIQSADIDTKEEDTSQLTTSGDKTQLNIEVYSSFRPAVSTKIAMERMETVQLSSGEEEGGDIDVIHEKVVNRNRYHRNMLLRLRLRKTFENLKKKRMFPWRPIKNIRRLGADNPITISSDSDTDIENIDHQKVVENLRKRNSALSISPVDIPSTGEPRTKRRRWTVRARAPVFGPNCSICHIEFDNMMALNKHLHQFHLRCDICNRQFRNLSSAQAHKELHHLPSQSYQKLHHLPSQSYQKLHHLPPQSHKQLHHLPPQSHKQLHHLPPQSSSDFLLQEEDDYL